MKAEKIDLFEFLFKMIIVHLAQEVDTAFSLTIVASKRWTVMRIMSSRPMTFQAWQGSKKVVEKKTMQPT